MPYEIPEMAGKPYEPSNGDEGRMFMERFCEMCIREDRDAEIFCPISTDMLIGEQREEWTHDERGRPVCTAYKPLTWDDERRAQELRGKQ